jgi:hypothetical protein
MLLNFLPSQMLYSHSEALLPSLLVNVMLDTKPAGQMSPRELILMQRAFTFCCTLASSALLVSSITMRGASLLAEPDADACVPASGASLAAAAAASAAATAAAAAACLARAAAVLGLGAL